jgi:hypothetical protein
VPNPGRTIANVQPAPNPAGAGNLRAARHAAYSDALVTPRARELTTAVFEANTHLQVDRDGAAVARYAVLLARVERVYRWLAEQPDDVFADVEHGVPHGVYERLERWERACADAEHRLAIDPLTRTRLGLARMEAFDLAQAMSALTDEQGGGDG